MATMLLPPEFKRLLSTLSLKKVEYLVVGGYAVNKKASGRHKDLADLDYLP
jgi:hypothetical protein